MVIETDMAGIMWDHPTVGLQGIGLSLACYLHKGNWNGEQVFNESWVKYTILPIDLREDMEAFWLNGWTFQMFQDMYHCRFSRANGGDYSVIDLVIVRMGLKKNLNLISMEC
jgi:hypothetical protein